jgi:hypothetical protein
MPWRKDRSQYIQHLDFVKLLLKHFIYLIYIPLYITLTCLNEIYNLRTHFTSCSTFTFTSILAELMSFCPSAGADGYRATPLPAPATIAGLVPSFRTNQQTFPLQLSRMSSHFPPPLTRSVEVRSALACQLPELYAGACGQPIFKTD